MYKKQDKKYIKGLENNIFIGYIYNFLMYFRTTNAIWVVYLGFKGLSLVEIGLLESIFHVTSFLCEIPTGALADIYGRKFSILAGRLCSLISGILMIISNNIFLFVIAFVFSGLSYTLNSGAGDSLIYDSLKEKGRQEEYKKVYGSIYFITEISQSIAVILGGWLADKRYLYAYLVLIIVDVIAGAISLMFTEPTIKESENRVNIVSQIKDSIGVLKFNPRVLYLILFFELICVNGTTIYFYCQKYFDNMQLTKTIIAVIFTLDSVVNALSSKFAYKIEGVIKQKGIIILLPVLNIVGIIGLALCKGYVSAAFFLVLSFISGFGYPIFSDYINSLVPSQVRATVLSIQSTCFSIGMIVFFPLVGFIGERIGLSYAFIIETVIYLPITLLILWRINGLRSNEEDSKNDDISI